MKEDILAIYNTLGKLQMPMTPDNAKQMAAIFIKLEGLFSHAVELEKKEEKNGGD